MKRIVVLLVVLLFAGVSVDAQIRIKIGTIAPATSVFVKAIGEMGDACGKRTGGRVSFVVFAGNVGSEETILRDIRQSRKLHAAQLSAISLAHLDDAFNVFGIPMFYQSYEEADAVLAALSPQLEKRLEAKGLKPLIWAYVGWIHVFSKEPVRTVADLKKLKLFTSTGDDRMLKWYRENGFTPVELDPTAMLGALSTGMVQAVPSPPLYAQLLTWYRSAPNMMDIGFAPLIGATVISLETWNRIAPEDQQILREEAQRVSDRLRRDVPRLDQEAVVEMKKSGLTVTAADPAEWRNAGETLGAAMRDRLVPGEIYDLARRERDLVRAKRNTR